MKDKIYFVLFILWLITGCGVPKHVVSYIDLAKTAENEGDYKRAADAWKNYFSQFPVMNEVEGSVYAGAALTAYKAGDMGQAIAWFDQARYRDFASAEMYSTLAGIFKKQDNLSRELSALEYLQKNFEGRVEGVNSRLFSIYNEIDLVEKALGAWNNMNPEAKNDVQHLDQYFRMNKKLGNEVVCDSLSLVILEKNPNHVNTLEWQAKKYYNQAESNYVNHMTKYENNKTRKQYRILLNELEKLTADFKQALGYFEKLWELNPGSQSEYAGYISNIYIRFNDEKNALKYRKLAD
ncbi:MAG: hypothetical protein WCY58_01065 [Mariniphaga sp.]|nr:hypothetical protein [Mariniphaga sp.]